MSKIGIMGGSFNPIHNGHLALGEYVMSELALDEVWFVPTGCSYMKADVDMVPGDYRLEMTRLATDSNDKMKSLDIEVKRDGYTYTYETAEQLKKEHPTDEFYYIYGADCLFDFEKWKFPDRIFASCTIVVNVRNGASVEMMQKKIEELQEKFHAKILLLPFYNLEISSTELRKRIGEGKSVRYLVPDAVISYIEEKGFYRS